MDTESDPLAEILGRGAGAGVVEVDIPTVKLAVFAVGDGLFAFPGEQVIEILPLPRVYFVPGCPPTLEGVIDVRGEIWSVIRSGDLLGVAQRAAPSVAGASIQSQPDPAAGPSAAPRPGRDRPALLLGRTPAMESALRVDAVVDVFDCPQTEIAPPPDTLPEPLRSQATGVFLYRGRSCLILDMERLFAAWRECRG